MSFFSELKRRNVIRMAGLYLVGAWLVVQVSETLLPIFDTPVWVLKALILLLAIGFVPALVFSWLYELTPDGLKRDGEVSPEQSAASSTGRRMDRLIFAGLLAVIVVVAADRYWPREPASAAVAEAAESPSASPTDGGGNAKTTPSADDNSIAVLPFANLSGDAEQEYFSDGMTEELLTVLAKNPQLRVAARTSVFAFKGRSVDVREIGEQLGVSHIIEGSVRREGEQLRITVQMIRVADGFQLWSESFDRRLESVFAVQDEIASAVAAQLELSLRIKPSGAGRSDIDPVAYDHYLQGRKLLRERRQLLTAVNHFRSAVELAPGFAAGWAALSLAIEVAPYGSEAAQQYAIGERLPQMRESAMRAFTLEPDSALTLHAMANVARADGRLLEAETLYLQAIDVDPAYSDGREDYAELLTCVGRSADALAAARELLALDPLVVIYWYRIAAEGIVQDRDDLIEEAKARMAEGNAPFFYGAVVDFRRHYQNGRFDQARLSIERAYRDNPEAAAPDWLLFRWSQSDPDVDDGFARQTIANRYGWDFPSYVGMRGDVEFLIEVIGKQREIDKRYQLFASLQMPAMVQFLADARVRKVLSDAGFEAYWRVKGWPSSCRPKGEDDFVCAPADEGGAK